MEELKEEHKRIFTGLEIPGPKHYYQRHNIGFRVVDALADAHGGVWQTKGEPRVHNYYNRGIKVINKATDVYERFRTCNSCFG